MSNAEVRRRLYSLCESFIIDNDINCTEDIYHSDRVISEVYEFLEEMCDIIGYADFKDKEEPEDDD